MRNSGKLKVSSQNIIDICTWHKNDTDVIHNITHIWCTKIRVLSLKLWRHWRRWKTKTFVCLCEVNRHSGLPRKGIKPLNQMCFENVFFNNKIAWWQFCDSVDFVTVREPCHSTLRGFLYGVSVNLYHCGTRLVEEPDSMLDVSKLLDYNYLRWWNDFFLCLLKYHNCHLISWFFKPVLSSEGKGGSFKAKIDFYIFN